MKNRIQSVAASLLACIALFASASARAQDLYDPNVLRTINLTFNQANYWTLLQQNYASQTNIACDLTVDGVTYPNVGIRFRGNTSYTSLPAGSQKTSFNIDMDWMVAGQSLMGYNALNLNNGFHDPTFAREVVYNNIVSKYIPNARANHVQVTINGQNWGVYINVQQYNKDLLRDYFDDEDGLRIKCANNPNGPGLRYNGANQSGYTGYEIKDDGGLADPWGALIAVANSVTNEPLATWQNIDAVFAIDPSIWSVVFENLLTDDDSYVHKGADFMLYRNPVDGRMHLNQTDANETFTQVSWSPIMNFTSTTKPVLSHVLAVPELRQRYMSHYRVAKLELNAAVLDAEFTRIRNLIDAAVQADPKKLYSYTLFQQNFTTTVNLPYAGPAGGTVIGLSQFVTQRLAVLNSNAELSANGPVIGTIQASEAFPDVNDQVWITAQVTPAQSPVSKVELFYLPEPGSYERAQMFDDGAHHDGASGDGVFGALLPVAAHSGQRVAYYVGAVSNNAYQSSSFKPTLSENAPLYVEFSFGTSGVRITEFMYQGANGEFFELTNLSASPIDLTGWSMDDDSANPGTFSLSAAGVLDPGESMIVTDGNAATFTTAWGLSGVTVLGTNTAAALGRNDQINIFDADENLVERLRYGDETFPGTIRTQNKSGFTCGQSLGQDDIAAWTLAVAGDVYGSYLSVGGDRGRPGHYLHVSCFGTCEGDVDGSGTVDGADLGALLGNWGLAGDTDLNGDGTTDGADLGALLGNWGNCD